MAYILTEFTVFELHELPVNGSFYIHKHAKFYMFLANIYLLKVTTETLEKSLKYVQS